MSYIHEENPDLVNMRGLLEAERAHILARRAKTNKSSNLDEDSLGIALSGGGIRSATICLGVLEQLNERALLQNADYLSSVSGGGYLAAYIHGALQQKLGSEDKVDDQKTAKAFAELFSKPDTDHFMKYREYLYVWRGKSIQRIVSNLWLFLVALRGTIAHSLWFIAPFLYRWLVYRFGVMPDTNAGSHFLIMIGIALLFGFTMSPNITSPHSFYKRRLKKAYLLYGEKLKLWQLNRPEAPYPIINANVSVDYDKYDQLSDVSYRGPIKSNYFIFTPLFCGSQVTNFTKSKCKTYRNMTLATAMATSAAAVNTFMGNFKLPFIVRQLMAILNLRTGILAPNPQFKKSYPSFWPYYTFMEVMGNSDTTKHYIQVSDGGHIENLGIYELLRRQTKVIVAIDAGADRDFKFEDLRNLVIRARNELGIEIDFHKNAKPQNVIRPDVSNGFSDRYFVVAKVKGLKGAYNDDYEGILIYIKSALTTPAAFELRNIKNMVKRLVREKKMEAAANAKLKLDRHTYRTYNPDFPHEPTSDQFFDEAQWNAYHELGAEIGDSVCDGLGIVRGDSGMDLFEKGERLFGRYDEE